MAQPQSQIPPRAFSPPQHSPSPVASQSGFALPPNKRVRTDMPPSQPESPYAGSPYAASPGLATSPQTNAGSPAYSPQSAAAQPTYATPYTNGHTPSGLNLPEARPNASSPVTTPQPQTPSAQYTQARMAPISHPPAAPAQGAGVMGPPQRPAGRPTKDYEYDVNDTLAGTGINLHDEEQYLADMFQKRFDANPEAATGLVVQPPGPKSSFYGAGPANQPVQPAATQDQDKFAAQAAEQAWAEASMRLGAQRTQEMNDAFLLVSMMHRQAEKIAKEHHLSLNLDLKNTTSGMGKMRLPEQFPAPKVTVKMQPGPDSTMVQTTGSFIPHDAFLADQLALLSIATKQRLRDLVQDASNVASTRQKTSHGDVPEEWQGAAGPLNVEPLVPAEIDESSMDVDSAISPGTNPLKRSADAANLGASSSAKKLAKASSFVTQTMRDMAKHEREWEESRLRRRQKRKDGPADGTPTPSRSGSVAPGTPGSVAPDFEKSMTKKEMKKNQAAKAAEAHSHANQNMTSSMFAGFGGKSGLFGKKKSDKAYNWMNIGRGGGGTNTPTKPTPGASKGTPGATTASGNPALTTEGRNRLGTWREDKEKGKNIQLRDWVVALERDGRELRALHHAYAHLDESNPR